jgi:hypothetical protein
LRYDRHQYRTGTWNDRLPQPGGTITVLFYAPVTAEKLYA